MDPEAPAIAARGLGRDYGAIRALDHLDLTVAPGTLAGILGPNGAGKTTALLLLATLLRPSRGDARLLGLDITRNPLAIRRHLGLVFQEPSLDPYLTVEENLLFAARLTGLRGRAGREAIARLVDRLGLGPRLAQPARQLSGGWRRIADLARAVLHRPRLLLLDEPTVGLDPEYRDRAWRLLDEERRTDGVTVLFSTHYLPEAERADQVALLASGSVVADGAPATLIAAIGDAVVEIEGDTAPALVSAISEVGTVATTIQTERGFRLGLRGPAGALAHVAGLAARATRLSVRPPTLDDVYFARTQRPGSRARGPGTAA